MTSKEAFVTLATNDQYGLSALVLGQSIRATGTKRNLVVMISSRISEKIKALLVEMFDELVHVDELNSNDEQHLSLLSRPELGITFTKFNCWLLDKYSKCVFLDADCLLLKNVDDLFDREELSASRDAGWPDCFNSGVFVYRPSKETFRNLMNLSSERGSSFDGGDQGLLNQYFSSSWNQSDRSRHLPFTYNVTTNQFYSYLPALTRYRDDIHILHFAGSVKPWQTVYNIETERFSSNSNVESPIQQEFFRLWWKIFADHIMNKLLDFNQVHSQPANEKNELNVNHRTSSMNERAENEPSPSVPIGSAEHRRAWESGLVDYFGRDSFSNIEQVLRRRIDRLVSSNRQTSDRIASLTEIDLSKEQHKSTNDLSSDVSKANDLRRKQTSDVCPRVESKFDLKNERSKSIFQPVIERSESLVRSFIGLFYLFLFVLFDRRRSSSNSESSSVLQPESNERTTSRNDRTSENVHRF